MQTGYYEETTKYCSAGDMTVPGQQHQMDVISVQELGGEQ